MSGDLVFLDSVERREFAWGSLVGFGLECDAGFRAFEHVRFLASWFERLESGDVSRLCVSLPPRHSKSFLTGFLVAWFLWRDPSRRVMLCSYNDVLAGKLSSHVQGLFRANSGWLGVGVSERLSAVSRWGLEGFEDFGVLASGVGGSQTGFGTDLLVVDDPLKNLEEASSVRIREKVWGWFGSAALTRLEPGGRVLVVMTRWHDDDLVGRLVAGEEGWEYVCLPALAVEGDLLGREPGVALCEERFSVERLERVRGELGSRLFGALYQQDPVPEAGGLFDSGFEVFWDWKKGEGEGGLGVGGLVGAGGEVVDWGDLVLFVAVDVAGTVSGRADFSVAGVFGLTPQGGLLVVDLVRGRWRSGEVVDRVAGLCGRWGVGVVGVEVSPVALAVVDGLRGRGLVVRELRLRAGGKLGRAYPLAAGFEGGRVFFPGFDPDWLQVVRGELYRFPVGGFDDVVDCLGWGWFMGQELGGGSRRGGLFRVGGVLPGELG